MDTGGEWNEQRLFAIVVELFAIAFFGKSRKGFGGCESFRKNLRYIFVLRPAFLVDPMACDL